MKGPTGSHLTRKLLLLAAIMLTGGFTSVKFSAFAGPAVEFVIESHSPDSNEIDVPQDYDILANFNLNVITTTINADTFTVHGDQSGYYDGGFSFPSADLALFTPADPYKPGETIFVTGNSNISSETADNLIPYTWQFTAEAKPGGAVMYSHPISPTVGADYSYGLSLGDLDGDEDLDIVVANSGAEAVWLNNWPDGFTAHPITPTFGADKSYRAALGDLDGDGDLDAVVANDLDAAETVWMNDGTGGFSPHPTTPSFGAGNSTWAALGDLDNDGDLDAVIANVIDQAETVWLNDGNGTFTAHPGTPSFGAGYYSNHVALGDLDGDGDLDAVFANGGVEAETVWLNDGFGGFSAHPTAPSFGGQYSDDIALGDIDHDGDLDAVVANRSGQAQTVWQNDGTGKFGAHIRQASFGAGNSRSVSLGDLDGDGDLDAMVANYNEPATIWINDGLGVFKTGTGFGAENSNGAALGDLDGDDDLDVVLANDSGEAETVWLNGFGIYLPLVTKD